MEALNMVMPLGSLGSLINNIFLFPMLLTLAYFMGHYFMKAVMAFWRSC